MVTEVVTLFSNMLDKYRRETDADHMAVIFDASGAAAGLPGFAPRAETARPHDVLMRRASHPTGVPSTLRRRVR